MEYIADETQGGASSYSYLARYIGLLLIALAFVRGKEILDFSQKICAVYIIAAILFTINGLLLVMLDVYNARDKQKNRPMKGFVQVLQVLLFFIGGIVIIAVLVNKSPMTLFAGLGASAAVLMLVFKDSILGFVAGYSFLPMICCVSATGYSCPME